MGTVRSSPRREMQKTGGHSEGRDTQGVEKNTHPNRDTGRTETV